jgi:glutamyl-tRNA synthetase
MSEESVRVRVRYAPSPTGYPHIGNIRTALFNWLFARHSGGKFIVRIEDTDQSRKVDGALESILESLRWLGMDWDEGPEVGGEHGPYFQSQRVELYQQYAQKLLEGGKAYKCYCSPERLADMRADMAQRKESMRSYDRHCRELSPEQQARLEAEGVTPVIRFKAPIGGETTFNDLIRGDITFNNSELDDLVLVKSDGYPTYHLANIVDDHFMQITHVMRADEWLSSTPRHVLLYRALGWEPPLFAHLPMILGPDKSKLSKRHGAASLTEYRDRGYLPEAMLNFLALLGWALDDKTDIIDRESLIKHFTIDGISKTGAIFSHEKLDWMNGMYMRQIVEEKGIEEFIERAMPFLDAGIPETVERPLDREYLNRIAPLIYERVKLLSDAPGQAEFFLIDELDYDSHLLLVKGLEKTKAIEALEVSKERLKVCTFDATSLEDLLRSLAEELGLKTGQLFGLLRVAVTGRTAAPPLFQTMEVLGKDRCLKRIAAADRLQD